MKTLGKIDEPEQYYPVSSDIVLSDSNLALDFFEDNISEKNGAVCLVKAFFTSLKYPFMLLWAYVSAENKKILSLVPVFKIDNLTALDQADIVKLELIEGEVYFIWNGKVHAAIWTHDKEIAVRQVRSILSENDMRNVMQMRTEKYCEEVSPVKMFHRSTGKFLGIFWMCSLDEYTNGFELVCQDDTPNGWNDEMLHASFYHLIGVGEKVIIDHSFYELRYHPKMGQYFVRLPFLASESDYRKQDIPEYLFKKKMDVLLSSSFTQMEKSPQKLSASPAQEEKRPRNVFAKLILLTSKGEP